jgi:phosphatidylglycerophosphatase A
LKKAFHQAGGEGKIALILASWFGSGLAPVAPGTFGTLAGLPLAVFMGLLGVVHALVFVFLFIAVSVWAADVSHGILAKKDPPVVVVDEVAGLLLAVFLVPLTVGHVGAGFLFFRLFDVWKPFPIKHLEKLRGGFGIVADDLLAGVYANLSLRLLFFFVQAG